MAWLDSTVCFRSGLRGLNFYWLHLGFSGWSGDVLNLLWIWFSHNYSHLLVYREQYSVNMACKKISAYEKYIGNVKVYLLPYHQTTEERHSLCLYSLGN